MSAPSTERWTTLSSNAIVLAHDDIDTDQIIPARFLTTTSRRGLGVHCFADWRYASDGAPRADFPFNAPRAANARILVAGFNFGCGSSREHAPWSLVDAGVRAIIAGSFADIFCSNAHKNGLLTIAVGDGIRDLHRLLQQHPDTELHVDLARQQVTWAPGHAREFAIDAFAKRALLEGLDEMGMLLAERARIEAWERQTGRALATERAG